MTVSFVLRLVSRALRSGEIVGRVEEVESGDSATVSSITQLEAFLVESGNAGDQPKGADRP